MSEFEDSGFKGMWMPAQRLDGAFGLMVLAKRRFRVDLASARCEPDEALPEIVFAPELEDEDDIIGSPVRAPMDLAAAKERVDLMVRGTAYAPRGKPAAEWEVALRIPGVIERRLRIVGPRTVRWVAPKKLVTDKQRAKGEEQEWPDPLFTEPTPIAKLPLSYRYAYGGSARLVLSEEAEEMAAEAQEEAKEQEERRERKKEIEAELKAEEEAKVQAAEEAKERAAEGGPDDEVAREKAAEAFGGGGTRVVDAETLDRLAQEDAEEQLEVASPLRLGRDLPDRPAEAEEAPAEEDAGAEGDEPAAEAEDDPLKGMFSEGTQVVDLDAVAAAAGDELAEVLDEHAEDRRKRLKDAEGTYVVRTDGMGDVALTDDAWIDAHGRPIEKPAEEPQVEDDTPTMPWPGNPGGRGFVAGHEKDAMEGVELPQIEDPAAMLVPEDLVVDLAELDLDTIQAAAGFGPYGMGWFPRGRWCGVMPWDVEGAEAAKLKALEDYDPEDPDDQLAIEAIRNMPIQVMQARWYQEANPELQVPRIDGAEDVYLENLTPDGMLFFRLPGVHPKTTLDLGEGPRLVPMTLDTVLIDVEDPEAPFVDICWRGWHPLVSLEALEGIAALKVRFGEVDQVDWMDLKREEEAPAQVEGLTRAVKAITDEDLEEGVIGEEAERVYKDEVGRKAVDEDAVGPPKDDGGTVVIDLQGEHKLTEDWDDAYREDKEAFLDEAAQDKEALAKAKDAARKKKAREQADEEFGIERDDDEDGED